MNADVQDIARMAENLQSPGQGDLHDSINGLKRKAGDEGSQAHQRARRNRYVSIACNECKRRKIKCNGETPCQRCGNLSLECVYSPNCCSSFRDSQEYKEMSSQIAVLQDQVNALYEALEQLRAPIGDNNVSHVVQAQAQQQQQPPTPIDPSLQSSPYPSNRPIYPPMQASPTVTLSPNPSRPKTMAHDRQTGFRGPTSSDFNLSVAKSSLKTMGIAGREDEDPVAFHDGRMEDASPVGTTLNGQCSQKVHADKDPLWTIPWDEAMRLCKVYEEEIGSMYSVLNTEKVKQYAAKLYQFMDAARRTGLFQQAVYGADAIDDVDSNILKTMLATALTCEACGRSDLGRKLFESVQPAMDNMLLGSVGIKGIQLLTLTSVYEFQCDNEGTSWRIIGLAARLCVELGLHRRETYDAMQDESERLETIHLFWSIYILDRRWSFGTGMPFALQEVDIDPQLSKPDASTYLSAMIQYSNIGSKVWRAMAGLSLSSAGATQVNTEEMNYLDYQLLQWHRSIPASLRFQHPSEPGGTSTPAGVPQARAARRLQAILYLRANQMRILIYRPVLHSATSIMQHREQSQTVVDVAKDTIRVLTHIHQTADIYRTQQMLFNPFLTSALAVLFLAVSHTPVLFAESVREEFYMALDMVRGFSKGSWISKRLWKTIRVLKEVGPRLGLVAKEAESSERSAQDDLESSRSAAVAMAGLAGHNVDEMALYHHHGGGGGAQQWMAAAGGGSSTSPEGMANDLTSLFEAAGGYQSMGINGRTEGVYASADGQSLPDGFAGDDGLSNILRDLF